jgi:hypothetical protein
MEAILLLFVPWFAIIVDFGAATLLQVSIDLAGKHGAENVISWGTNMCGQSFCRFSLALLLA